MPHGIWYGMWDVYLATITCLTCATAARRLLLDGIGEVAGPYAGAAVDALQLVDGCGRAAGAIVAVDIRGVVARPLQVRGYGGRRHVPVVNGKCRLLAYETRAARSLVFLGARNVYTACTSRTDVGPSRGALCLVLVQAARRAPGLF